MFIEECLDGRKILRYTFTDDDTVDTVSLGMITNADIPGICGCSVCSVDGETTLIYDLSDKISLTDYAENGSSVSGLRGCIEGIVSAIDSASEYLIPISELVDSPERYYIDSLGCGYMLCLPVLSGGQKVTLNGCLKNISRVIGKYRRFSDAVSYLEDVINGRRGLDLSDSILEEKCREGVPAEAAADASSGENTGPKAEYPVYDADENHGITKPLSSFNLTADKIKAFFKPQKRKSAVRTAVQNDSDEMLPHGACLIRHRTGGTVCIDKIVFRIGKDPSKTDYTVSGNPAVSRLHAEIRYTDGKYTVTDCGSTNRTFVDGKVIGKGTGVPIKKDSIIRLADEDFTFSFL